jgi:hypothetical protein
MTFADTRSFVESDVVSFVGALQEASMQPALKALKSGAPRGSLSSDGHERSG